MSAFDPKDFLAFCSAMLQVTNWAEFERCCDQELRSLLQFRRMIAATGSVFAGTLTIEKLVGCGYPNDFLESVNLKAQLAHRKLVKHWLVQRSLVRVDHDNMHTLLSELEQSEFNLLDLQSLIAHGVLDAAELKGSYFSFADCSALDFSQQAAQLALVVAPLHQTMTRLMWQDQGQNQTPAQAIPHATQLSGKELHVLNLLCSGHSNNEIAMQLHRSNQTIKHHVASIFKKLGVSNRAQAATAAAKHGLSLPDQKL